MDKVGNINLYNADCMDVMRSFKDNEFDLAIVDPPYGIDKAFKPTSRITKYGQIESVNNWNRVLNISENYSESARIR